MGGLEKLILVGVCIWLAKAFGRRLLQWLRNNVLGLFLFFAFVSVALGQGETPPPDPVYTDSQRFDVLISGIGYLCGIHLGIFAFQLIRPA